MMMGSAKDSLMTVRVGCEEMFRGKNCRHTRSSASLGWPEIYSGTAFPLQQRMGTCGAPSVQMDIKEAVAGVILRGLPDWRRRLFVHYSHNSELIVQ